jgi:thymidine kinase
MKIKKGWLEVIAGSMYSGKTEELIRRLRRARFAKQHVQVFKPIIDDRYHQLFVSSHDLNQIEAIPLDSILDVWSRLGPETQVIGFDEGQFFTNELVSVCQELVEKGYRVIVAGLDMDWKGQPFEPIPSLMAIAEDVMKPRAICTCCGELASYSQKISGSTDQIEVGAQDRYEARCRNHFKPALEYGNQPQPEAQI